MRAVEHAGGSTSASVRISSWIRWTSSSPPIVRTTTSAASNVDGQSGAGDERAVDDEAVTAASPRGARAAAPPASGSPPGARAAARRRPAAPSRSSWSSTQRGRTCRIQVGDLGVAVAAQPAGHDDDVGVDLGEAGLDPLARRRARHDADPPADDRRGARPAVATEHVDEGRGLVGEHPLVGDDGDDVQLVA